MVAAVSFLSHRGGRKKNKNKKKPKSEREEEEEENKSVLYRILGGEMRIFRSGKQRIGSGGEGDRSQLGCPGALGGDASAGEESGAPVTVSQSVGAAG